MIPKHLTVSQLNRQIRLWLEQDIGEVNVEGEISNLSRPSSGHLYFTLKDETAQLKCVFFRNRHKPDNINLQNGQKVLSRGVLSLYEARGDYQLIVSEVENAGLGDLFRQFEILKQKLQALGLFEQKRKKAIPLFPQTIGIITSKTAAALQDILTTLKRRYPIANIIIYTSEVQGARAPVDLIRALKKANIDNRCDVILLARGGGSMEDLWAFNNENLAYEIVNSNIPVVSGVGHEIDFTIADFVSDLRCATPTAAAESITPDMLELLAKLDQNKTRIVQAIIRHIQQQQLLLKHILQKIASPRQLIQRHWQAIDYLLMKLQTCSKHNLAITQHQLSILNTRLAAQNPVLIIENAKSKLNNLTNLLTQYLEYKIQTFKAQLSTRMATLDVISPLATLERGYSIASFNGKILYNTDDIKIHSIIDVRLANGSLQSKVTKKT